MNQLKIILPRIVSLVSRPANKKAFYVMKEESMMAEETEPKWAEIFPVEADILEAFKAEVPDAAKTAIKEALTMLNKWKDNLPSDVLKSVSVLGASIGYGESFAAPKKEDKAAGDEDEKAKLLYGRIGTIETKLDELVGAIQQASKEVDDEEAKKAAAKKTKEDKVKTVGEIKSLDDLPEELKQEAAKSIAEEVAKTLKEGKPK